MPIIEWNTASAVSPTTQTGVGAESRGVTVLSDGSYVIAWSGRGTNGTDTDVYVRHYDVQGRAISAAILVNADNALEDTTATAVALPNGGYAIVWLQNSVTVLAQKFNANDSANGGVIAVALDSNFSNFFNVSAAAQDDGTIAVAYSQLVASEYNVVVKIIAVNGSVGAAITVPVDNVLVQSEPFIVARTGGGYLMTWTSAITDPGNVLGRILDGSGNPNPVVADFTINTTLTNTQGRATSTQLSDGRFVVVWQDGSQTGLDTSSTAVRGQILSSSGVLIGQEFLVNSTVIGDQFNPNVTALPNGGFFVIFRSAGTGQTIGRAFDATGAAASAEIVISVSTSNSIDAAALSDGRVVITWGDNGQQNTQILDPRDGQISGNNFPNTLYGNNILGDNIRGFGSPDTVYGLGGNDLITGGSGNDRIYGGAGRDTAGFSRTLGESTVIRTANGSLIVSNATDGADILRGVETLQFSDRSVQVQGYARSDVNGDGDSDILYFSQAGGAIGSFSMEDGFRTSTGAGSLVGDPASGVWDVQATGDFNYDGNSDLVLKNQSTGLFYIWTVQNGTYVGGTSLGTIGTNWDIRSTGDFNADGNSDLLWRDSSNGQFYVWTFNANTVQTGATNIGVLGNNWDAGTAGDFDGDGDSDILLRNSTNGQVYIYSMQNAAISSGTSVAVLGTDWSLAGTGDFNGDGRSDIALKNTSTGQFYLYLMTADLSYSGRDLSIIGTDWNIGSTGDYNEDGTDDILWRNTNTGQIYAWQMEDGRQATTGANHLGFVSADTVIV